MDRTSPSTIDRLLALPMFLVTMVFLVCLAGGLQSIRGGEVWPPKTHIFWWVILGLYPIYWVELVIHWRFASPRWYVLIVNCILPPFRLASRDRVTGEHVWLPWLGWRKANDKLLDEVESDLSLPMIFVALLILPLLAIEYFWRASLHSNQVLRIIVDTGQSIVWMAFTIEFLFMIAIANKKLSYAIKHWVDIFVICMPLLAFVRLARLGAVLRLHQVTKVASAYRMRGVAMRLYRSILLLNIIDRVLRRTPERRLEKLRTRQAEIKSEMADLMAEIKELEKEIAARND